MTTPAWQPGFQGVTVVPPGFNDPHNWSPASALQLVATTGINGFALQNATPVILSYSAPNDGQLHYVIVTAQITVTSTETGGAIGITGTGGGGVSLTNGTQFAGGGAAPGSAAVNFFHVVAPGSTFTIVQTSALTAGAAAVYAEIWAA